MAAFSLLSVLFKIATTPAAWRCSPRSAAPRRASSLANGARFIPEIAAPRATTSWSELAEEISYHRDEDYKIVRLRDDLISAVRYAFMTRTQGKMLDACESYGRAPGVAGEYDPRPTRADRRPERLR
jgi:hypothetical protein